MHFDIRPIVLVIGVLVALLGAAMLLPALVDYLAGNPDWQIFFAASFFTSGTGLLMFLATRGVSNSLNTRQAFVLTTFVWVMLAAFGALPFYWSSLVPSYTDAFFESISAITTTGATVMTGLDSMPPGILLWRGVLQWLGGLGIIVMAVSVLPMLQIGGMQLFKAEAFDTPEKILPRATQISGFITTIFVAMTAACMLAYLMAGMSLLDASVHAMTTVATGGFSNHDASLAWFESNAVNLIAALFMVLGSLPFLLYVQAIRGNGRALFVDSQVRAFISLLVVLILLGWVMQEKSGVAYGFEGAVNSIVNVTSILTGAGYTTTNYQAWGPVATAMFFFIMFIGGCAGSTSCGIKIFRFQVLFMNVRQHLARVIFPHGIFLQRFKGHALDDSVISAVMSFFFLYMLTFAVSAMALSLAGLEPMTALSGAGSAISNVGPGLGNLIGPTGNYQSLGDLPKWILAITMLIGRLELFTVLVLLSPRFWQS